MHLKKKEESLSVEVSRFKRSRVCNAADAKLLAITLATLHPFHFYQTQNCSNRVFQDCFFDFVSYIMINKVVFLSTCHPLRLYGKPLSCQQLISSRMFFFTNLLDLRKLAVDLVTSLCSLVLHTRCYFDGEKR